MHWLDASAFILIIIGQAFVNKLGDTISCNVQLCVGRNKTISLMGIFLDAKVWDVPLARRCYQKKIIFQFIVILNCIVTNKLRDGGSFK